MPAVPTNDDGAIRLATGPAAEESPAVAEVEMMAVMGVTLQEAARAELSL